MITNLPEIVTQDRAEQLFGEEISLIDMAVSIASQGDDEMTAHINAINMAEELSCALDSESESGGDFATLQTYAQQLKLFHLDAIARRVELPDPIEIQEDLP